MPSFSSTCLRTKYCILDFLYESLEQLPDYEGDDKYKQPTWLRRSLTLPPHRPSLRVFLKITELAQDDPSPQTEQAKHVKCTIGNILSLFFTLFTSNTSTPLML